MYYIVPEVHKTVDGFFVPIEMLTDRLHVKLPLENNPVEKCLKTVACWLGIRNYIRMNKANLITEINNRLSTIPMEEAVIQWPQLGAPLSTSLDVANKQYSELTNLDYKIRQETPQFNVHVAKVRADVSKEIMILADKYQRQKQKEKLDQQDGPHWLKSAFRIEPTTKPYYKISLIIEEQGHDGYCTGLDEDDLRIEDTEQQERFLPEGNWDFDTVTSWRNRHESHCCCGASWITKMISVEKIE